MVKGSKRIGSVTLLPPGQARMSLGSVTMKRHGQEAGSFWTLYAPVIGTYYLAKKQEAHLKEKKKKTQPACRVDGPQGGDTNEPGCQQERMSQALLRLERCVRIHKSVLPGLVNFYSTGSTLLLGSWHTANICAYAINKMR